MSEQRNPESRFVWRTRLEHVQEIYKLTNSQLADKLDLSLFIVKAIKRGRATPSKRARLVANETFGVEWPLDDLEKPKNGDLFDQKKTCERCGQPKDLKEFDHADGCKRGICKECHGKAISAGMNRSKEEAQKKAEGGVFYRVHHRAGGAYLKEMRKAAKETQRSMGRRLGVTDGTISYWELGRGVIPKKYHDLITDLGKHLQEHGELSEFKEAKEEEATIVEVEEEKNPIVKALNDLTEGMSAPQEFLDELNAIAKEAYDLGDSRNYWKGRAETLATERDEVNEIAKKNLAVYEEVCALGGQAIGQWRRSSEKFEAEAKEKDSQLKALHEKLLETSEALDLWKLKTEECKAELSQRPYIEKEVPAWKWAAVAIGGTLIGSLGTALALL